MSDVFNLLDGELDRVEDKPGFRNRRTRVGERLGAELLGATLYETRPGEKLWPYHWELGCEEFLVVVAGAPTLRTPEGERTLAPGDVVAFPEGEAGAHQLRNDTDAPFRVLIASTKSSVYVAGYPDSGKLLIDAPERGKRTILRDAPELDYWDGE
ncbi:MAG TPA: cupin domain-containing protein [Gaiellaceae bacterium]|nr:cupin domain-containing protein [Gaiellaceae bacterium]